MLIERAVVQLAPAPCQVVENQLADSLVADLVAVDEFLQGPPPGEYRGPHRRWCGGRELAHLVQDRPGQLAGELAAVLLSPRFHVQPLIAGLPHVVQERLGRQVSQGDALRGQRDRDVEQRRGVVHRVHRMVLYSLPEILQQRVALGGEEPLPVAVEPGGPQRPQRGPDHAQAEQAGHPGADLLAPP